MPIPTLLKRSRLDESIAKLKELVVDLESGLLGKEPKAVVVIEFDGGGVGIYGLAMDSESIAQSYFILGKAMRRYDGTE
jgi:hypothetical protein